MLTKSLRSVALHPRPMLALSTTQGFSSNNKSYLRKELMKDGFEASRQKAQSKEKFIKREMQENPEFFKAFPHLQKPLYEHINPEMKNQQYLNDIKQTEFLDRTELEADSTKNSNYYDSLFHQHKRYMEATEDKEDMLRENEVNFIQGYNSPAGPFKYMSAEAKEKVH
jgi:hypothetical protein